MSSETLYHSRTALRLIYMYLFHPYYMTVYTVITLTSKDITEDTIQLKSEVFGKS